MPPSDDERQRQALVLSGLRAHALKQADNPKDWQLTPVASRIGVSASQLSRYESGQTILPTTYYRAIADTYGITRTELARALGILDDESVVTPEDESWSLEDHLRSAGVSHELIVRALDMGWGESVALQKRIADSIISIDRERRAIGASDDTYQMRQRAQA